MQKTNKSVVFQFGQRFKFKGDIKVYEFDSMYFVDNIPYIIYYDGHIKKSVKGLYLLDLVRV